MTSPREQAIEAAARAVYTNSGRIGWDAQLEVHKNIWLNQAREYIDAYLAARARLDGAKMMPREATEAAISAFYVTVGEMSASETRDIDLLEDGAERIYRAMHDATPKEKTS